MARESIQSALAECLGVLWIVDGLLQFQPAMFGQDFVNDILVPGLSNQPYILNFIVQAGITIWNLNPVVSNIAAALLQTAIGVLLLFPLASKKNRFGLWLSVVWGIVVWFCGEGAGLLFTGTASL